jgi:hypothetical protein
MRVSKVVSTIAVKGHEGSIKGLGSRKGELGCYYNCCFIRRRGFGSLGYYCFISLSIIQKILFY